MRNLKREEFLALASFILAILSFLIGDNIYQQITGNSIFQNTPLISNQESDSQDILTVSASKGWQETGIRVDEGNKVSISYVSGSWTWTLEYPKFDSTGDPQEINTCKYICDQVAPGATPASIYCPIEELRIGTLVGKLGSTGEVFYVGKSITYQVPAGTRQEMLYLRMNDCGTNDNDGAIQINIQVSR